jgi:acylphosphatase
MLQSQKIIVQGKVQGVYYRQSTREKATELGITGIVKNLANGDVEIIATGTREQLDRLTDWCKQGPAHAIVTNIIITSLSLQSLNSFSIIK